MLLYANLLLDLKVTRRTAQSHCLIIMHAPCSCTVEYKELVMSIHYFASPKDKQNWRPRPNPKLRKDPHIRIWVVLRWILPVLFPLLIHHILMTSKKNYNGNVKWYLGFDPLVLVLNNALSQILYDILIITKLTSINLTSPCALFLLHSYCLSTR